MVKFKFMKFDIEDFNSIKNRDSIYFEDYVNKMFLKNLNTTHLQ